MGSLEYKILARRLRPHFDFVHLFAYQLAGGEAALESELAALAEHWGALAEIRDELPSGDAHDQLTSLLVVIVELFNRAQLNRR